MKGKKSAPEAAEQTSFEVALARLEKIVQELEGGELTLEETLARYEEGSRLAADCARRLEEAEQRIKILSAAAEASPDTPEEGTGEEKEDDDGLPF